MRALERHAKALLEASWLALVVLVPMFIDKNGVEVFEPAKVGILRGLALVMLAAWVTSAVTTGPATRRATDASARAPASQKPLLFAAAGVGVATLVSTALSISRPDSVWGYASRAQGALTLLSMLVVFGVLVTELKTPQQLRRLVTAIILPSLPIAAYAIAQRAGFEPLQVTVRETEAQRVTSLLGQPVFLAAYLAMVIPFTIERLIACARDHVGTGRAARLVLYGGAVLLQSVAVLLTESRGALLGLLIGCAVGAAIVAARKRWRRPTLIALAVAVCASGLLAVTVSTLLTRPPDSELHRIARRFTESFDVHGGGGQFRTANWKVAARVFENREPLELSDGTRDRRAALRQVVGYGPEVQFGISPPFYGPELTRRFGYFLSDRYHSDLWDQLITTGVLGLFAWLTLQTVALWHGMRATSLLPSRRRTRLFWVAMVGGAASGAMLWTLTLGAPFTLFGLQMGSLLGLAVFLLYLAIGSPKPAEPSPAVPHEGIVIAALAALVTHAVETQFSFTVTATGLLFWVAAAMLVAVPRIEATVEPKGARATNAEGYVADAAAGGALLGLSLVALGFAFLGGQKITARPEQVFADSLMALQEPVGARQPVVLLIVLFTLVAGALLFLSEPPEPGTSPRWPPRARWILGTALVAGLAVWMRLSVLIAARAKPIQPASLVVPQQLELRIDAMTCFVVAVVVLLALLELALYFGTPSSATAPVHGLWRPLLAAAATAIVAALFSPCVFGPSRVRAAVALGEHFEAKNKLLLAEQAFALAADGGSVGNGYRDRLAKAYFKHARSNAAQADAWFQLANQELLKAIDERPVASENLTNLAIIRTAWARATTGRARENVTASLTEVLPRALRLNPQDPTLWRTSTLVSLHLKRDLRAAIASAVAALERDPNNDAAHALVGECLFRLASSSPAEGTPSAFLLAASHYANAARLAPQEVDHRINEARAYLRAGQPQRALVAARQALTVAPATSRAHRAAGDVIESAESALAVVTESATGSARAQ